jgi:hypothetical protein
MRSKGLILLFYFFLNLPVWAFSAEPGRGNDPNVSFGIGGSFGYFNVYTKGGGGDWDSGISYGGGFVFEKMFSNRLGIHSGMRYQEARFGFTDDDEEENIVMRSYAVPLYLITAANGRKFSLNVLTGFTFSHIGKVTLLENSDTGSPDVDLLQYMEYNQVALSAGLNLKFRIGRFVDFFIGSIGDFHITKLLNENADGGQDHIYNIRGITGILFRTNLFPISENSQ